MHLIWGNEAASGPQFYSHFHFLVPDGLCIFCASSRSRILVSAESEQSVPLPSTSCPGILTMTPFSAVISISVPISFRLCKIILSVAPHGLFPPVVLEGAEVCSRS